MKDPKHIQAGADGCDGFVTKQDIAQRFNRTARTIEVWMRTGILPYYKVGRSVFFRLGDVERHFEQQYRCLKKPAFHPPRKTTSKPASAKVGISNIVQETMGGVAMPVGGVHFHSAQH